MTTNTSPANALRRLQGMVFNHDDVIDLISARLDDDFASIEAIDDRTDVLHLLDTIVSNRPFALNVVNNDF